MFKKKCTLNVNRKKYLGVECRLCMRWKRPESVRWEMDSRVAASRGRKSWHVHHGLWSFSLWIRNWLPTCWCDFFNGFSNSEQTCESFIYLSFTHICSESLEPFLRFMGIRFVPCVRFSEVRSDEPLCPSESVVEVLLGGIVLIYLAMEGHGK